MANVDSQASANAFGQEVTLTLPITFLTYHSEGALAGGLAAIASLTVHTILGRTGFSLMISMTRRGISDVSAYTPNFGVAMTWINSTSVVGSSHGGSVRGRSSHHIASSGGRKRTVVINHQRIEGRVSKACTSSPGWLYKRGPVSETQACLSHRLEAGAGGVALMLGGVLIIQPNGSISLCCGVLSVL